MLSVSYEQGNGPCGRFRYKAQVKNQQEFISQLSQELTAQNIRLQNTILVVTKLIGLMTLIVVFLQVVFEWRRRDESKEQKKDFKEEETSGMRIYD